MVKRKGIKTITLARKTLHRKLLIEQHEHNETVFTIILVTLVMHSFCSSNYITAFDYRF
jgi:hypothetical protein